jgi:signal transduction histidine kinase/DNA-binding NarL/FixJ family response regulator
MTLPGALARLRPGLTARLGLACIGAVTLGFILICSTILLDARRDATAQASTEARNIDAGIAQEVARNLDLYDLSLQAVAQGLQIPGLKILDPELRQMILFGRATKARYFSFINAIDETGTVIADSRSPTPRPGNWSARDYFTAQRNDDRDQLFIGRPFLTGPGQSATIPISRRMSHPDGSFAGVVVGTLRLAYFRDLFARLTLGPHATIVLLRDDGMILMRLPYNADDIGRMLPANAPFFHAPDGGQVDAEDPTDRQRRRFLFQRIGTLPLVVGVGLADADIYAAWRGKAAALGGVVAALAAIDVLLLLVVRHALARRELGEAALRRSNAQLETLAAQRERAVAVAAQTAAANTRFLATMSHELRTPLNSILGYAEMLSLDGNLQPVQAARIAAMRSAGDHLHEVVNRVLDFSRVEADDRPAPLLSTDLSALMAQCREIAEPMAAAKGLVLTCMMAPDVPAHVMADAASIRQVLLNLLGNAVKFTQQGVVTLRVTRCTEGVGFAVADTGVGVPAEQRQRLFQPYERLDADRIGVPGTGLGLAIAAKLVARMGGHIGHADNPAGGSVFRVELPLRAVVAGLPPGPPPIQAAAINSPARPLRVLVADDSAMNRDVAAAFLQTAGHAVVEATDGEAALRLVVAEAFDVVLMDLRMPLLDGIEATRQIRALPGGHGQTPVIAVTADAQEDHGAVLRAAGFQAWLIKPIDRISLLAAVAAAARSVPADASPAYAPIDDRAAPMRSMPIPDMPIPPMPSLDTAIPDTAIPDTAIPGMPIPGMTAEFLEGIDPATVERHLQIFTTQLADLLDALDDASAGGPLGSVQAGLAHRIAGDGGQLGFMALSAAARRYEAAWHRDATQLPKLAAALRDMARDVLDSLVQRRNFMCRAAMTSEKLP